MEDLTDPAGLAAMAAGAIALVALVLSVVLGVRVRRLRDAQHVVLGADGRDDLVTHAAGLQEAFARLHGRVEEVAARLEARVGEVERAVLRDLDHADIAGANVGAYESNVGRSEVRRVRRIAGAVVEAALSGELAAMAIEKLEQPGADVAEDPIVAVEKVRTVPLNGIALAEALLLWHGARHR